MDLLEYARVLLLYFGEAVGDRLASLAAAIVTVAIICALVYGRFYGNAEFFRRGLAVALFVDDRISVLHHLRSELVAHGLR